MNLYRISADYHSYDDYDSAIVAAPDEATARCMHPGTGQPVTFKPNEYHDPRYNGYGNDRVLHSIWQDGWITDISKVAVEYIGTAKEGTAQGVVLASFNAG